MKQAFFDKWNTVTLNELVAGRPTNYALWLAREQAPRSNFFSFHWFTFYTRVVVRRMGTRNLPIVAAELRHRPKLDSVMQGAIS